MKQVLINYARNTITTSIQNHTRRDFLLIQIWLNPCFHEIPRVDPLGHGYALIVIRQ